MDFSRSHFSRLLRRFAFLAVALIIIGYAVFRSLPYVRGPQITIYEPANGSTIATSTVVIQGVASRSNSISINGNAISVDEKGNFKDILIVFRGVNTITLEARDQFKRTKTLTLVILGSY